MPNYGYLINKALEEGMAKHKNMVLLGEDIRMPYGGAFKITYNLSTKYPDRVLNMPISEAGIVGFATGLAIRGYLPVVEIMFGDFLTLCFDQIYNHAAKFEWMYGVKVPVIIRTPMGGYRGYGPTHSQSLEKHFLGIPDLDVFALNETVDPKEFYLDLFENIERPTLVIENKSLYSRKLSEMPSVENPKVSIYCYGGMVSLAKDAVEKSGVDCEILAPTKLSPPDFIAPKTGNYICVEEGFPFFSWQSEVILANRFGEVNRIGYPGWIPCAKDQEARCLPGIENILHAINELSGQKKQYDVLLYGNGGHAGSILDIIGHDGVRIITGDEWENYNHGDIILAVGSIKKPSKRSELFNKFKAQGFSFPNVIHSKAHIEGSATLGEGVQVFANAVISSSAKIGDNCIINTGAIVSHDCKLGNNVHLAPGAILAGGVEIGNDTLVGMGVTVYAGVKIGSSCTIMNGKNITEDVPNNTVK